MISSLVLEGGRRLVKNPGPARLRKLVRSGKNIVWIDVQDPTDKDYDFLRADFDLHPLTVDDCRQDLEMPKTEEFSKYLFVGFHKVQYDRETREIELAEVDSILGKNYLVTVHKGERPSVISLRKRIEDNPKSMLRGADFLLHSLMDYIIDEYLPMLESWDAEIETLEDEIIQGKTRGAVEKLVDFRRRVSEMKRSIAPQRYVINSLSRGDLPFVSGKVAVYFRDIYDHISKAYGILESQRDLISSAFQAYSSTSSNQMNEIMKTLTLVATVMLPLTLVAGIYGMNFRNMPELAHPIGYFAVLGLMLAIGLGMIAYFKKKGWM